MLKDRGEQKLTYYESLWNNKPMKALLFVVINALLITSGCSLFYVAKQGVYQLKLVGGSEPIEKALRSNHLTPAMRKKLELVRDVRQFATESLHLTAHKNYKDINLDWHEVIHTVSACEALDFKPYQWWFPIIGFVPYKGFFDLADAQKEEAKLKALGFETQNRPISGYSTLGFFPDPIWPSMLELSDFSLIELIIHELAHATIYIPNQTSFNETLANFIGIFGARFYIKNHYHDNGKTLAKFDIYQHQLGLHREFFYHLYQKMDAIFQSNDADETKLSNKIKALHDAEKEYLTLPIHDDFKKIDWSTINNATMLSFKRYNYDDKIFFDLLNALHGNFDRFLNEVNYYGRADDAFLGLKNRIRELQGRT